MDEPLSALDRLTKDEILPFLERLHQRLSLPVIYVSHDMTEVERLADHLILMQAGSVLAAGPLGVLQSDPSLPLAIGRDAAVNFDATAGSYDAAYGILTLQIDGGHLLVPTPPVAAGEGRRLRIAASDVSLAREAQQASSILNALSARIVSKTAVGPSEVLVVLALGCDGGGAKLLARLTRRSWDLLELAEGMAVIAQVKGVALAPARGQVAADGAAITAPTRSA
jgi:molybdate transport system ATP-binding protein